MKILMSAFLCFVFTRAHSQDDKTLMAGEGGDMRLLIGVIIAVIAIVAIYLLLRKEDK